MSSLARFLSSWYRSGMDLTTFDMTPIAWLFVPAAITVVVGVCMLMFSNRERVYELGARIAYTGTGFAAVLAIIFIVRQVAIAMM